jgi:hypothetical protein
MRKEIIRCPGVALACPDPARFRDAKGGYAA